MEVNQLKYFILAAQLENLSRAALSLNITQPALSKSIANLEKELGAPLFERTGKRIALNERGRRFLDGALASVQQLDGAIASAQDPLLRTSVHVGLLHACEPFLGCAAAFAQSHPGVSLQLQHLADLGEHLDTDSFDALVYAPGPLFKKYKSLPLLSSPYLLAVSTNSPLAQSPRVALSALQSQRLVFLQHGKTTYEAPYHFCLSAGVIKTPPIFTNSAQVHARLIARGGGVGFVAQCNTPRPYGDGSIALLPLDGEHISLDLFIGFKRDKHLSVDAGAFARFTKDYFHL